MCAAISHVRFTPESGHVQFTQPVNAATQNWTVQPENWEALRAQWEYSHAANAAVNFLAFCCAALASTRQSHGPEADICKRHVRFTPESGHSQA